MELDRLVRLEARRHLAETPTIRDALGFFRNNPEDFAVRVSEFQRTCDHLNCLLFRDQVDESLYGNVRKLKEKLSEPQTIPTPALYAAMVQATLASGDHQETYTAVYKSFKDIRARIDSWEWQFPHEVTDPHQLASALLIEGYGVFLERLLENPAISRDFVLAFEEVLFTNSPDSSLLHDVVGWMKEEKEDFSPGVAQLLDGLQD